jgi:hypothetical protein
VRVVRVEIRAIAVYAVGVAFGLFYFRDEDVFFISLSIFPLFVVVVVVVV